MSSNIDGITGTKDELLASIVMAVECDEYISPYSAGEYIERSKPGRAFTVNIIELYYQNYDHPTYQQLYGSFHSHMAVIDLLFNKGFEQTLSIIRQGHRMELGYIQSRKDHPISQKVD